MAGGDHFVPWGLDHRAVLFVTGLAAAALVLRRRRLRQWDDQRARGAIAGLLVANEVLSWIVGVGHGVVHVPLQLCDLALLATVVALWTTRRRWCELAYFWGLTGSLQAVLTPDLQQSFPHYWWVKFFVGHCGVVLSAIWLAVTGRVQPTHATLWRIFGWTNVYAALAGLINALAGTNYGYLAQKPRQPSLLDWFGPWPSYILGMEVTALGLLYLCYVPFVLSRSREHGS